MHHNRERQRAFARPGQSLRQLSSLAVQWQRLVNRQPGLARGNLVEQERLPLILISPENYETST